MKIKNIGLALLLSVTVIIPVKAADDAGQVGEVLGGFVKGLTGGDKRDFSRSDAVRMNEMRQRMDELSKRVVAGINLAQTDLDLAKASSRQGDMVQMKNNLLNARGDLDRTVGDLDKMTVLSKRINDLNR
jgi:hypothetical protein